MKKLFLLLITSLLLGSCSSDYIYYKSDCACMPLVNHADLKDV